MKTPQKISTRTVAAIFYWLTVGLSAAGTNLVVDGGFETESGAWQITEQGGATISREKMQAGSGEWVLKVHIPQGTLGYAGRVSQELDMSLLKLGDTVTLSALVKVAGGEFTAPLSIYLIPEKSDAPFRAGCQAFFPRLAQDWSEIKGKFTVPADFGPGTPYKVGFHFFIGPEVSPQADCDIYFDDIAVLVEPSGQ